MILYHPAQALQFVPGGLLSNGVHVQPGKLSVSSVSEYHLYRGKLADSQTYPAICPGRFPRASEGNRGE